MSGVIAAIMSTVNSFLNLAAAALTRDIPRRLTASDAVLLRRGRVATVLVALLALALALGTTTLVALLGVFGWGLFASSLVPALALGLLWEGATRAGAIASMTVATLGTLGLETAVYLHRVTLPAGVNAAA
jgi:Na+/proline symporter